MTLFRWKYLFSTVILPILVLSACEQESVPTDSVVQVADTLHFLVPYDSIGIEVGDSTLMLGSVWKAAFMPDDRIAILDGSIGTVRFYSGEGDYISSFAPTGEGPGEFVRLNKMKVDTEGNLYLGGIADRKLAVFDSNLNLIKEIGFYSNNRISPYVISCAPDTTVVLRSFVYSEEADSAGIEIALFDSSSEPKTVYRRRMAPSEHGMGITRETAMAFTVGLDGRVYTADMEVDSYEIICFSAAGDSLFAFGIDDYQRGFIPDSILEADRANMRQQYINYYGSDEGFVYEQETCYIPIVSLAVDDLGRIWARGERDGETSDIFDSEGNFLYSMEMKTPDWQAADRWGCWISPSGILATPSNPELYPVVYMLEEVTEVVYR